MDDNKEQIKLLLLPYAGGSALFYSRWVKYLSKHIKMVPIELLKELGKVDIPVLLKRGISATIDEFLYAAEYIIVNGNSKISLCERGIRTFETQTRNTLDIACIALIKKYTQIPIIVDVSHSLGRKDIINQIGQALLALGVDGIMVEVHPKPQYALSDSRQQLNFSEFDCFIKNLTNNIENVERVI